MKSIVIIMFVMIGLFMTVFASLPSNPSSPLSKNTNNIYDIKANEDPVLHEKLLELVGRFKGDIGIYVRHIASNTETGVNQHSIFPTASIIKVPLLIGIYAKIKQNKLNLNDIFTYSDSQAYGGSGIMQFFKDNTKVDLKMLIYLMISFSDNVCSIWLQKLAGGGIEINQILENLNFNQTRVNSQTPGREEDWKKWGWGQTTPYEMANLLVLLRQKGIFSEQLSNEMYTFLGNHYYNERALSQIPPDIKTASKTGSLDESRSEVVFVNAHDNYQQSSEYVFSIFTNNNKDQSWTDQNEAEVLTRKLSKMLWEYYNPERP
jgi:beta-lactamase class A